MPHPEARNATTLAISSGLPGRFMGPRVTLSELFSIPTSLAGKDALHHAGVHPAGEMLLMRTPLPPFSLAAFLVMKITAAALLAP